MHLNLVRSCETPSDPTRCALPPWVPTRGCGHLARPRAVRARLPRGPCGCVRPRVNARGFSPCLAGFFRMYAAFVFRAVPRFRSFNASQCTTFHAAYQALRPCAASVSFRPHRLRLSLLCSAALILSQALRLAADSPASWEALHLLCCCLFPGIIAGLVP